jgi:molybdenum cofactor biosynthesis enzyme
MLEVLGAPITQQQECRDNYFKEKGNDALKVADIATLLYAQNGVNILRFCTASKLSKLVQTTRINPQLLIEFDNRVKVKLKQIIQSSANLTES